MSGDIHALVGAYALNAVDDRERAAFERHLDGCGTCRLELLELRETVAHLVDDTDAVPLPVGLRERTLAQVARTPQERLPGRTGRAPGGARRWRRWAAAAAVAAVAAAGGSAVTWVVTDHHPAQDRAVTADARRIADVLAAADAQVYQQPVTGGGSATLVTSGQSEEAVVVLRDLPAPGDGRAYQLWLLPRAGAPRSVGLLPGGRTAATDVVGPLGDVQAFGVSNEPVSGSTSPTRVVALLPLR
ncbi:anti-sigma factor [Micromonospora wenchangensis]|uniref:anti-sigma factor n=1 Tax=Micromonospora wenchangensis TaxID=1185415 RepID=UPI003824EB98